MSGWMVNPLDRNYRGRTYRTGLTGSVFRRGLGFRWELRSKDGVLLATDDVSLAVPAEKACDAAHASRFPLAYAKESP